MRNKTVDTIPILSKGIENIFFSFSNGRSLPGSLIKRSNIILLASKGGTNQNISKQVETGNPDKLKDEIKLVLSDAKRSGAPAEFSAEQVVRIIDLACKNPADFDYEVSHWSLPLLVKEIKKQGIAEQISEKTVSRFLKIK